MNTAPERAGRLSVTLEQCDSRACFHYRTDRDSGTLEVVYPFAFDASEQRLLGAIGVGVATYLGGLCLAAEIVMELPADPGLAQAIAPIAEMLYDIRCWKDGADLLAPPTFVFAQPRQFEPVATLLDDRRSLLLFSGGKDSTLAALALRRNGLDVSALHASANSGVEAAEQRAVVKIAQRLDLPVARLGVRHDEFRAFARRYACNWDGFPHFNVVPFGRDLLLGVLALPVLLRSRAGILSLGHDADCRSATVGYQGKVVPRNDIESAEGGLALERFIRLFAVEHVQLLPPLANLSELRILREMIMGHPELMRETAFCFWGDNCGRCAKCLRYYLAQRLFGAESTLDFATNPLEEGACPELDDIIVGWDRER